MATDRPGAGPPSEAHRLRRGVFHLLDLIPLSTSSVAPTFSIAAAFGVMVAYAGPQAIMSVVVAFPFFLGAALLFRQLNIHYPHSGASYHWGARIVGRRFGGLQAWIVTLAYFLSLPPILVPAGAYTLSLLVAFGEVSPMVAGSIFWQSMVGILWALVAALPLILGAKPTARFTEGFLVVEGVILALFLGIGVWALPTHTVNAFRPDWFFSFGINPLDFALALVVVATILDGWEIDSYASEESRKPKEWPGKSGIVGLLSVFAIYLITMPLLVIETPLGALASSTNPLATWMGGVMPQAVWGIDLAVIISTASSLWLTAFILSRAWYAMGRDGLLPKAFARVHARFQSPWVAIAVITVAEVAVQLSELTSSSVFAFFSLVLTAAGIFLLAEFALDSVSATVQFRGRHHGQGLEARGLHVHSIYRWLAPITAGAMFTMIVLGFLTNATLLYVSAGLLVPAAYFVHRARRAPGLGVPVEIEPAASS
ncbi:MAG: APC family permease [Thermoplasmata archaeon]|jgi:amino acid transporter